MHKHHTRLSRNFASPLDAHDSYWKRIVKVFKPFSGFISLTLMIAESKRNDLKDSNSIAPRDQLECPENPRIDDTDSPTRASFTRALRNEGSTPANDEETAKELTSRTWHGSPGSDHF